MSTLLSTKSFAGWPLLKVSFKCLQSATLYRHHVPQIGVSLPGAICIIMLLWSRHPASHSSPEAVILKAQRQQIPPDDKCSFGPASNSTTSRLHYVFFDFKQYMRNHRAPYRTLHDLCFDCFFRKLQSLHLGYSGYVLRFFRVHRQMCCLENTKRYMESI